MARLNHLFESDLGIRGADADASSTVGQLRCEALFAASREPVLIIDSASGRIVEANPSAVELLNSSHAQLIGAPLKSALDKRSAAVIDAGFAIAQLRGGTHELNIKALRGAASLCVRISLIRAGALSYFLLLLGSRKADRSRDSAVVRLIDKASVGFLITDVNFGIEFANREFIAMLALRSQHNVRGKSLARWLKLSAAELSNLELQLRRQQAVTRLQTQLRSAHDDIFRVEVDAIAVPDDKEPCWGFCVNRVRFLN